MGYDEQMKALPGSKVLLIVLVIIGLLVCLVVVNYLAIRYNGTNVPAPTIPRQPEQYGRGRPITYAVLGDSTSISQGGDYDKGYARGSARYLASKGYLVSFQNFGISGARTADLLRKQVPKAATLRPDIVLIAVGANDTTHFTNITSVRRDLAQSIADLRKANPTIKILLTGSPQMGSVPRFPEPSKTIMRQRSAQVNRAVRELVDDKQVFFVPIADETGPVFMRHPDYYAADKFHPNTTGYGIWTPVVTKVLDHAIGQ